MALREILAKFGFDVDASKLNKAKADTDSFKQSLKEMIGLIGASVVYSKIKEFVSDLQDQGAELRRTSTQLGLGVQEYQKWKVAAKFAGIEAESLANGIKFLEKNAAAASEGSGEAADAFKSLGVDVKDASGNFKDIPDLLKETGLAIAKIDNPAEKTAATLKIFGRQGLALIPLFAKGADGLEELLGALDEYGGGLSDEAIAALKAQTKEGKKLDLVLLSLKSTLATKLVPGMTASIKWMVHAVLEFKKMADGSNVFQAAVVVLSAIAGKALLSMYAKFIPIVLVVALIILLLDDLITFFKGGDSAIGRFLDKILGAGSASAIAKQMREDWAALNKELEKSPSVGGKITEVLSTVGASLVRFVVQDIPDFVSQLLFGTTDGFNQVGRMISSKSAAWLQQLNAQIGAIPGAMVQLGKDMLQSLADGIKSAISVVEGSITDLASAIKAKLKGVFDWHSPIPLFVDLGADMAKGVPKGLAQGQQGVESAISRFAGDIGGATQGAAGGSRVSHIQSEVHVQIQAGAGLGGVRDAVREGATAGLGDLNAELAALEAIA